jgi:hypothetical protein
MGRHVWAPIAPETGEEPCKIWKWCIRCGALELGNSIFEHGTHQGTTLISAGGMKRRKEAKTCPFKKLDPMPTDIAKKCDEADDDLVFKLDNRVHDIKSEEASSTNNGGPYEQAEYLHDEAGWSWNEIREFIGLKEKKA